MYFPLLGLISPSQTFPAMADKLNYLLQSMGASSNISLEHIEDVVSRKVWTGSCTSTAWRQLQIVMNVGVEKYVIQIGLCLIKKGKRVPGDNINYTVNIPVPIRTKSGTLKHSGDIGMQLC